MTLENTVNPKFSRWARLISPQKVKLLSQKHVMVIGLGGVGSWAAEALARSGIGRLTLIDFDKVSVTNINRQLPAMHTTVGELKTEVLAARLKEVVPEVDIKVISQEIQENILPDIILNSDPPDYVIDAIDQLGNKCKLIDYCYKNKIPLVTSMGAGGKMDPTKIRVFDLADTQEDALAKSVRFYLRRKRNFPRDDFFDIPAVCSLEKPHRPWDVKEDGSYNPKTLQESRQEPRNTKTKVIMGTAAFVTPVFGFTCASIVIRKLLGENIELDETPRAQEIRRMKKTAEKKLLKKQKKS